MNTIPENFPRNPIPASVSGAQPKFVASQVDGRYVLGLTEDERKERYHYCEDLVQQLKVYADKKHAESPQYPLHQLLENIAKGINDRDWDLSSFEHDWIIDRLFEHFEIETRPDRRVFKVDDIDEYLGWPNGSFEAALTKPSDRTKRVELMIDRILNK